MLIFQISEPLDFGSSLFLRPMLRDGCYQSIFVQRSVPTRRCFLYQEMIKFSGETPEMGTVSWKLDCECFEFISLQKGWILLSYMIGYDVWWTHANTQSTSECTCQVVPGPRWAEVSKKSMAYRNVLRCRSNEVLKLWSASTNEQMVVEMPMKWLNQWINKPMHENYQCINE